MNSKIFNLVMGVVNLALATTLNPIWQLNLGVGLLCVACAVFLPNDK